MHNLSLNSLETQSKIFHHKLALGGAKAEPGSTYVIFSYLYLNTAAINFVRAKWWLANRSGFMFFVKMKPCFSRYGKKISPLSSSLPLTRIKCCLLSHQFTDIMESMPKSPLMMSNRHPITSRLAERTCH